MTITQCAEMAWIMMERISIVPQILTLQYRDSILNGKLI